MSRTLWPSRRTSLSRKRSLKVNLSAYTGTMRNTFDPGLTVRLFFFFFPFLFTVALEQSKKALLANHLSHCCPNASLIMWWARARSQRSKVLDLKQHLHALQRGSQCLGDGTREPASHHQTDALTHFFFFFFVFPFPDSGWSFAHLFFSLYTHK